MKRFQGKSIDSGAFIDGRCIKKRLKWIFECRGCSVYLPRHLFGGNNSYCFDCSHFQCPVCHKEFKERPAAKKICCSKQCSKILFFKYNSSKGKKLWKLGHEYIKKNPKGKFISCEFCKKENYKYPKTIKMGFKVMFCGKKCFILWSKSSENPNWHGDSYPENKRLRQSLRAKKWKKEIYKRANYSCEECGERGSKDNPIHADHIKSWALYPELRFDLTNGRCLCKNCHKKTDTWGVKAKFQSIYAKA